MYLYAKVAYDNKIIKDYEHNALSKLCEEKAKMFLAI